MRTKQSLNRVKKSCREGLKTAKDGREPPLPVHCCPRTFDRQISRRKLEIWLLWGHALRNELKGLSQSATGCAMSFIKELKRRNVISVAITYRAASCLFPHINQPGPSSAWHRTTVWTGAFFHHRDRDFSFFGASKQCRCMCNNLARHQVLLSLSTGSTMRSA